MALNVSIEGNPFARPCPFAAIPLSPDGKGRLHCDHCRKQVSDLRGLSLFQVAVFVRGNPEACIIMGAASNVEPGDVSSNSPRHALHNI